MGVDTVANLFAYENNMGVDTVANLFAYENNMGADIVRRHELTKTIWDGNFDGN